MPLDELNWEPWVSGGEQWWWQVKLPGLWIYKPTPNHEPYTCKTPGHYYIVFVDEFGVQQNAMEDVEPLIAQCLVNNALREVTP